MVWASRTSWTRVGSRLPGVLQSSLLTPRTMGPIAGCCLHRATLGPSPAAGAPNPTTTCIGNGSGLLSLLHVRARPRFENCAGDRKFRGKGANASSAVCSPPPLGVARPTPLPLLENLTVVEHWD